MIGKDGMIRTDGKDLFTFVVEAGDEAGIDLMKSPNPQEVVGTKYQTWEELGRGREEIEFDPHTIASYIAKEKGYGLAA